MPGGNIAMAYFRPHLLPELEFDTDTLCTEYIGRPQYLVVLGKRAANIFRPPFRYEAYRMKVGHRHGRGRGRLERLRQIMVALNFVTRLQSITNRPVNHHDSPVSTELFAFPLAWIRF
jgi:hypothetical protein